MKQKDPWAIIAHGSCCIAGLPCYRSFLVASGPGIIGVAPSCNAKWTTPEEVPAAMLYLCSDDAKQVNGVRVAMYGGKPKHNV